MRVLIAQSGSSVDAKSVLRNVPVTIGLTSHPTSSRRCGHFLCVSTEIVFYSLVVLFLPMCCAQLRQYISDNFCLQYLYSSHFVSHCTLICAPATDS